MKKTMIQIEKKMREGEQPLYYVQINDDLPFGYILTEKQLEELYLEICQYLFDNLLEQNKDVLMRLKNNEPAPKMINSDKVIAWLVANICDYEYYVKLFKKDFGL